MTNYTGPTDRDTNQYVHELRQSTSVQLLALTLGPKLYHRDLWYCRALINTMISRHWSGLIRYARVQSVSAARGTVEDSNAVFILVSINTSCTTDRLQRWIASAATYPVLSLIARHILPISATVHRKSTCSGLSLSMHSSFSITILTSKLYCLCILCGHACTLYVHPGPATVGLITSVAVTPVVQSDQLQWYCDIAAGFVTILQY